VAVVEQRCEVKVALEAGARDDQQHDQNNFIFLTAGWTSKENCLKDHNLLTYIGKCHSTK